MAYKRSRSSFEDDLISQESPFVTYGTALPPLDKESRDDGSYVPIWKQEVTDERGRKRLHGAFTGGFSAGYFNTVGSKEGWTPSTFVSSRTNRRKDAEKKTEQRPEDFMDEEDLAEAAEAQKLQTSDAFLGLGSTGEDEKRNELLKGLLKTEGETMGIQLLRKMGWRDGQGIGPRVRRKAQLDDNENGGLDEQDEHLFAPADSRMITFTRKDDRKGLGFMAEGRLAPAPVNSEQEHQSDNDDGLSVAFSGRASTKEKKKPSQPKVKQGGFGVGVLNDLGSDDDDPYEVGPRISYNRVIGGDKAKAKAKTQKVKPSNQAANPLLSTKPVFMSKRATISSFKKCHDGRLPLNGFVLYDSTELSSSLVGDQRWPRPLIPPNWQSSKIPSSATSTSETPNPATYKSTAEVARASQLDPKARAAILGEAQLPGKSVFDFLSTAARDRIVSASGKTNLPAALGEAPPKPHTTSNTHPFPPTPPTSTPRTQATTTEIPELNKDIALAALSRGAGGWTPYADDPAKLSRYRAFLEYRGGITLALPPTHRPADLPTEAWIQELREFAHAAQVFRPMTGMMASRFTSSSATPASATTTTTNDAADDDPEKPILLHTPAVTVAPQKPEDPAEAAARMGMFGPMTRSVLTFYPTRLVCKRFGIKAPAHVQPDGTGAGDVPSSGGGAGGFGSRQPGAPAALVSKTAMDEMLREAGVARASTTAYVASASGGGGGRGGDDDAVAKEQETGTVAVDVERNEALEGKRAGDAVFRAIFGSDDED